MTSDTEFTPGLHSARAFRDALGQFATGVAVVTIPGPYGPAGITVNSFASVSLVPPLVLWSPGKSSTRHDLFAKAPHFSIHVLRDTQLDLSQRFSKGGLGFGGLDHALSPEGVPIIPGTLARFDCAHAGAHDAGDHTIVVGRVLRAGHSSGKPLVFWDGRFGTHQTANIC